LRVLLVEGHLGGGNEMGLENAVQLVRQLQGRAPLPVSLMVVGDVPPRLREVGKAPIRDDPLGGVVKREQIPRLTARRTCCSQPT
jgi:hypothetical protein